MTRRRNSITIEMGRLGDKYCKSQQDLAGTESGLGIQPVASPSGSHRLA